MSLFFCMQARRHPADAHQATSDILQQSGENQEKSRQIREGMMIAFAKGDQPALRIHSIRAKVLLGETISLDDLHNLAFSTSDTDHDIVLNQAGQFSAIQNLQLLADVSRHCNAMHLDTIQKKFLVLLTKITGQLFTKTFSGGTTD